ncbi:hypothetical protein VP01_446g3 [Puccinia sorghi]|uniref:CCHC-type domain-containing protein n=1 Tax=Puccinia sorghi TaxID=27349 RepID=A0A0L6UPA9_9BASI|nr:hypothetical protein VP01_446g3 [Puccinia sorghi]
MTQRKALYWYEIMRLTRHDTTNNESSDEKDKGKGSTGDIGCYTCKDLGHNSRIFPKKINAGEEN